MSRVVQIVLIALAVVMGSSIIHVGVGLMTGQMAANRLKEYEQRWKEDDARIEKMEAEIRGLEKKRDELRAAAAEEMKKASTVAAEGRRKDEELRKKPLTPEEQAQANGTRALAPQKVDGAKGMGKGQLNFKKTDEAEAAP